MSAEWFHAAREMLAPETLGAYEARRAVFGPFTATFERVSARFPEAGPELYEGMPDCACQVPHWGYVFKGKLRFEHIRGGDQIVGLGEAYDVPLGHRRTCLEEAETVEFSPTEDIEPHMQHVAENLARMESR